jgi:5-methylcytosine-specific restriction endonuclease McrA
MTGFYTTTAWRRLRKRALERDGYRCVVCRRDISGRGDARVDHIKPLRTAPHLALNLDNLRSLCANHDNQSHREKGTGAALRDERFIITGCDADGSPIDLGHHWHQT